MECSQMTDAGVCRARENAVCVRLACSRQGHMAVVLGRGRHGRPHVGGKQAAHRGMLRAGKDGALPAEGLDELGALPVERFERVHGAAAVTPADKAGGQALDETGMAIEPRKRGSLAAIVRGPGRPERRADFPGDAPARGAIGTREEPRIAMK